MIDKKCPVSREICMEEECTHYSEGGDHPYWIAQFCNLGGGKHKIDSRRPVDEEEEEWRRSMHD